jgi:hypothetical protein
MGLDKKDIEMMTMSIPTVDYWEMKEELDRLSDCVERLERCIRALALLHKEERVRDWELILKEMLKQGEDKARKMKPVFEVQDIDSGEESDVGIFK